MLERLQKFLRAAFAVSHSTMDNACPHCGGGKCLGVCGSSLAKLQKRTCTGVIVLNTAKQGQQACIMPDGELSVKSPLTFDPHTWMGKMILRACPPGRVCTFVVLVQGNSVEKLISVKASRAHGA